MQLDELRYQLEQQQSPHRLAQLQARICLQSERKKGTGSTATVEFCGS